jgi:hypothetical protein
MEKNLVPNLKELTNKVSKDTNLFKPRRIDDREKKLNEEFLKNETKFLRFIKGAQSKKEEKLTTPGILVEIIIYSKNYKWLFYIINASICKVCSFSKGIRYLERKFKMDWVELNQFLKIMFEKHLDIKDIDSFF